MIQRQMWTSLGLGALSILLIALPGSSSQTKEASKAARSGQAQAQETSQAQVRVIPDMEVQVEPLDNEVYVTVNDPGTPTPWFVHSTTRRLPTTTISRSSWALAAAGLG